LAVTSVLLARDRRRSGRIGRGRLADPRQSRLPERRGRAGRRNRPGCHPEPEDIEIGFVALDQVFVGKASEALGFGPLMAIRGVVAAYKIIQVGAGEGVGLQGEVLVGAEIVDPERAGPRRFGSRLAVEEEHVGLDALGVEDAGGQAQ